MAAPKLRLVVVFGAFLGSLRAPCCAKAVPKAFSYWIQTSRFRSADGFVFGAFLGHFARVVPLRFAVLEGSLWGLVLAFALACPNGLLCTLVLAVA